MPILVVLILTALVPAAAANPAEYLPTDHWAYDDLAALWSRGAIDSLNLSVRPWSRIEIARSLSRGLAHDRSLAADPQFARVWREFAKELSWLDQDDAPRETPPILAFREGDAELRFLAGVEGSASGAPPSKMQIDSRSGLFVAAKGYFWPSLYVGTEVWAERTGTDRPIGDPLVKNEDFYLGARESYLSLSPRHLHVLFGLTETRWGPGRTGTLLLGDAADPYVSLRLQARIGRLDLTAVHGSLVQADRRWFAAHRLTLAVTQGLSVGLSEAARYDAVSPELLYALNLIPYTLVERFIVQRNENDPDPDTRNNVIIGLDVVWRPQRGLRLWAELLADELSTERADIPHRVGWQLGGSLHRVVGGSPVELAFEYSKVFRYTYSVFYDRDFVFAGDPLGFTAGPDTERYTGRVKADLLRAWSTTLDLDLLRRGEGFLGEYWEPSQPADAWSGLELTGVVESTVRAIAGVQWTPRDNVRGELGIGLRHVRNVDHVEGRNDTDPEAFVRLFLRK